MFTHIYPCLPGSRAVSAPYSFRPDYRSKDVISNRAKRRCTKADKLRIIQEAASTGVQEKLSKYDVYPATYYSWRRKFQEMAKKACSTA